MMGTKIPYVDEVWNPVVGCTKGPSKCSPGCLNCYAERMARRLACMGIEKYQAVTGYINEWTHWLGNVYCDEKAIDKPLHWRNPRKILTCSMGDLFHEKVPFWFFDKAFATMTKCPQHEFMVLTKRPKRMKEFIDNYDTHSEFTTWPKPNVHLGVSICTQEEADEKIPILLSIPAAHRWLSIEPLLGEIDLTGFKPWYGTFEENQQDQGLHQIIVGCESGPKRRPIDRKHIKDLYEQCKAAGVDVMVKQMEIDGKVCHDLDKIKAELGD